MSSEVQDVVTLGADVGGKDAHAATHEHIIVLRKLLRQECSGPYSTTIKEFALVLRIDGEVQSWGKSGVEGVALRKNNSFATADIFVPRNVWAGDSSHNLRSFLADEVMNAVAKIGRCSQSKKVDLSIDRLSYDVDTAVRQFLA